MQSILFPQIRHEVGLHAAGDLMEQHTGIDDCHSCGVEELTVLGSNRFNIIANLDNLSQIQTDFPICAFESNEERFNSGLGGTQSKGRQRRIDNIYTGFRSLQECH